MAKEAQTRKERSVSGGEEHGGEATNPANKAEEGEGEGEGEGDEVETDSETPPPTDPLLFTWEEISDKALALALPFSADVSSSESSETSLIAPIPPPRPPPELRVVVNERSIRIDATATFKGPVDAVHLATTGGFEEFKSKCRRGGGGGGGKDNK